ncbi:MAG TPA: ABC transporter permease [Anaerolineales bacterium]|nr:ABC transporter permease [Anaerolineales bacterium]
MTSIDSNSNSNTQLLTGPAAWFDSLIAMSKKELLIMIRYPVEFIASFGQVFIIVTVLTLAGLMFSRGGLESAGDNSQTSGLVIYGFILFMFLSDTLWTIGYNVRREQKQGTLEQLYLSPASKFASLVSRVTVTLIWTGLLSISSAWLMSVMIGRLPFANIPLGAFILIMALCGTFGIGFAFAALTLRIKEAGQTMANMLQFAFMVLCAPFFPFSALPDWIRIISRFIPLSYAVDAFRSTLMGFPSGYPELAPIGVELVIVILFGLLMPLLGYWLYRREENQARATGSLSEY